MGVPFWDGVQEVAGNGGWLPLRVAEAARRATGVSGESSSPARPASRMRCTVRLDTVNSAAMISFDGLLSWLMACQISRHRS
jgi:hypothetical protein